MTTSDSYLIQHSNPDQPLPQHFWWDSPQAKKLFDNTCQSANSIIGFSKTLERWCIIQVRCKRWGCRHCGERKAIHFSWKCSDANPNKLITLTVANSLWESPRKAFEGTKAKVANLATKLRRQFDEFEYFKVLEVTKAGWPHYHLIVRSPYIPQSVISSEWALLTGAKIVDVRKIKKTQDVYFYVVKYLCKQHYIPWTNRRVSWSKNFFDKETFAKPETLNLVEVHWLDEHPRDVICRHFHPFKIDAWSRDCFTIHKDDGFVVGTPIGKKFKKRRKSE